MIDALCLRTEARELSGVYRFGRHVADLYTGRPAHVSPLGNICAVDGRIDRLAGDADARVLALYEEQGAGGLKELIGDWSLMIWDVRRRAIVLASDYAGARPLYYSRSGVSVMWSTSLPRLARMTGHRRLDPDYVAEYLHSGYAEGRTPYQGILPVPAGQALTFTETGVEAEALWTPPGETSVEYAAEAEYEERFRALFEDAVAVRLQTPAPVAAELSGGLDSSSIVCMADRLIRSGAVAASGLVTFSFDVAESPDRRFMGDVEKACPTVSALHIDGDASPVITPESASVSRPTLAERRLLEVRSHMDTAGCGVLLTGQFGDLITGNVPDDSVQAADYLRNGRPGKALRELLAWGRSTRTPVYPLLRNALRAAYGAAAPAPGPQSENDSLTPSLRAHARERARQRAADPVLRRATPSRRQRLSAMRSMFASRFFQCPEPLEGLMYSHPFTHRPLVEFMLSIPPALICRPGEPRRLMRRALRGILPETVWRRRSKGNYEGMFLRAMRRCAAGLMQAPESLRLVRMGCVDAASVGSRLMRLSQGLECNGAQLRQIILLELWLEQRFREGDLTEGDGLDA